MTPLRIMVIAGEASGDMLAAELVRELRATLIERYTYRADLQPLEADLAPSFFGAGGPRMADAGVELAFDLTSHAVVGLVEVLRNYGKFRKLFHELLKMAVERQPHVIICVDFSGFNRRFAHAVKRYVRSRRGAFFDWNPRIVQYVSPQVWASREGRAYAMARDFDLLLSIFPFEPGWYRRRVPLFRVEFVGHPMLDRYGGLLPKRIDLPEASPLVLLLPGSRVGELKRHLPVMILAWQAIAACLPKVRARMVLPTENLAQLARATVPSGVEIQIGGLADSLREATIAIASTGTVTMECAYFGVPTVTLYRTSWSTYEIGKRLVKVKSLTMPNLLAGEAIFPEFIQHDATPAKLADAALGLLQDPTRRGHVRARLREIMATLGGPGASRRAAGLVTDLLAYRNETPTVGLGG